MSVICYCGNKECRNKKCQRHWYHTRKLAPDTLITYAYFKGNETMCPLERNKRSDDK